MHPMLVQDGSQKLSWAGGGKINGTDTLERERKQLIKLNTCMLYHLVTSLPAIKEILADVQHGLFIRIFLFTLFKVAKTW
jgi:hypothetical protein